MWTRPITRLLMPRLLVLPGHQHTLTKDIIYIFHEGTFQFCHFNVEEWSFKIQIYIHIFSDQSSVAWYSQPVASSFIAGAIAKPTWSTYMPRLPWIFPGAHSFSMGPLEISRVTCQVWVSSSDSDKPSAAAHKIQSPTQHDNYRQHIIYFIVDSIKLFAFCPPGPQSAQYWPRPLIGVDVTIVYM